MTYRFVTDTRDYNKWKIHNNVTMEEIDEKDLNLKDTIKPYECKLTNGDLFKVENSIIIKTFSLAFEMKSVPGVVLLNEQIYGSYKDKHYYKCIPDDVRLPCCLVPFKIKQQFNKNKINKYVVFKYKTWDNKHPHGELIETIGDVTELNNFYEYQLYCKSLNSSIQNFTKQSIQKIKQTTEEVYISKILEKYPNIEDRRHKKIITIDHKGSQDLDDAMGYENIDDSHIVSIYISNVPLWMEVLDLWSSFSERISTIYLPDRKRPMLPTILSDCLCSLKESQQRFVFGLDITIQNNDIIDTRFSNSIIKVEKNYMYHEKELKSNDIFTNVLKSLKQIYKKYKYLSHMNNSHDVVTYLAILMNYHCAKSMVNHENGIYRSVKYTKEVENNNMPNEVFKFYKIWNSSIGQYVEYDEMKQMNHDLLELESYVHITSPIRRLIDMLNMTQLMKDLNMFVFGNNCEKFCIGWIQRLDYINSTMKAIRKVQNDCQMLDMCSNKEVVEREYYGYIFNKILRSDNINQYIIYISDISMTTKLTVQDDLNLHEKYKFKLYVFSDEYLLKRKIRIQLID